MIQDDVRVLVNKVGVVEAAQACNVAGVLFTYRCSIACRHCCFGCSSDRPDVVMTPQQCVEALAMLLETGRVVHIAGGEAMLYWSVLRESIELAAEKGVAPHFIETNCSFAVSDGVARERLTFLAEHGVAGILASADAFHQEHVPIENVIRVRTAAYEIFGEENFYGRRDDADSLRELEGITADPERLRDYVRGQPPVMVGTAWAELSRFLDHYEPGDERVPKRSWRGTSAGGACGDQFRADTMWELHVDPYGNIQTNCGMILGNVSETTPVEVLAAGPEKVHRFVEAVARGGPLALAWVAQREYGFEFPAKISQACDLCYTTRRFLSRFHPEVFGPAEVYM